MLLHAIPVKMVPNSELYKELHNRMLSGTENTAFVKLVAHHMAARDIWCTVPEDLILKAALHHSLACMARAAGEQHAKDKGCYDVAMAAEDAVLEAFSWPTISLRVSCSLCFSCPIANRLGGLQGGWGETCQGRNPYKLPQAAMTLP